MMFFTAYLPQLFQIALVLPMAGAVLSLILYRQPIASSLVQSIFALSGIAGLIGIATYFFGGSAGTALAIMSTSSMLLIINPLSAFFLAIVYAGIFLASIYSIGSLPRYKDIYSLPWLAVATAFFMVGMQSTLFAGNIFAFLLSWEAMSLSAYFLVIADASKESLKAGFLYFIMTHIGYASLVAGFLLLSGGDVFASWSDVGTAAGNATPLINAIAFVLLFIGFGSKAGLVPLHQWLPYAHPQAPSASSALLSGVMLKVALYGFLMSLGLYQSVPLPLAILVIVIGLLSALLGVIHAAIEHDAKRLLAWSSIENMGLLFTGVGIFMVVRMMPPSAEAIALASGVTLFVMLHAVNHFLFKSGLFMAVGAIASRAHTRNLDDLGGVASKLPLFSGVALVLSLGAAALPPFGTFFGEWTLLQTLGSGLVTLTFPYAIAAGFILLCLALIGGLALFTFIKLFSAMFLGRARTTEAEHVRHIGGWELASPLIAAVSLVLSSLVLFPKFASLTTLLVAHPWVDTVSIAAGGESSAWGIFLVLLLLASVIVAAIFALTRTTKIRSTDTWDCGQPITASMQYTSTGFAAPIRFFFRSIVLSKKRLVSLSVVPTNPWVTVKELDWSTASLFETWLYMPIAASIEWASSWVKRLQSGIIQVYIILVVVALIGVLIAAL
jgi:hydrogenase-4 component B